VSSFDNIPHDTIISLLSRNIHDKRFLKLVKQMLQAGYTDDWQYHRSYSGTPQGGIVSPLLANIVLHELDCYVEDELQPLFTAGKRRKSNREYNRLWEEKRKAKVRGDRKRYQELSGQLRQTPRYDPNDPVYRRLRYVRYADDFLLGFIGPKNEARHIKTLIGVHLRTLGLTLSEEKTHITHARTQAARFLGYDITTAWDDTKLSKRQGHKVRALNGTIQLRVPREVSTRWIQRYTRRGKPHHIGGYIELSDYELVETFGAQLRGLTNYYLMADNVGKALSYVRWVCLESLRKTLAGKHKIRKPAITYQKYYRDGSHPNEWRHIEVTVERKGKRPLVAKCGETPLRTHPTTYSKDNIPLPVIFGTKSELLTRLVKGECELCGRTADLEAHHVNKLKNLQKRWQGKRAKPQWVQFMLARRRKTLVVCQPCHTKITHGKYDGEHL
jgi:hypothetical protein